MKLLKNVVIVSCLIASIFSSCDIDWEESPGYRFGLFKDTPLWELAKAVKHEDTAAIRELIQEKHFDVNYQLRPHWGETLPLAHECRVLAHDSVMCLQLLNFE